MRTKQIGSKRELAPTVIADLALAAFSCSFSNVNDGSSLAFQLPCCAAAKSASKVGRHAVSFLSGACPVVLCCGWGVTCGAYKHQYTPAFSSTALPYTANLKCACLLKGEGPNVGLNKGANAPSVRCQSEQHTCLLGPLLAWTHKGPWYIVPVQGWLRPLQA